MSFVCGVYRPRTPSGLTPDSAGPPRLAAVGPLSLPVGLQSFRVDVWEFLCAVPHPEAPCEEHRPVLAC